MNRTKSAAILALIVALAATGYLCFVLCQNVILLKSSIDGLNGIDDEPLLRYGISGGIAVVALITSLALFGAAKDKK
jgi:hypothetical protein